MDIRRADKIAETLEHLVFSGVYQNGERLDELKLAEKFKVSRTPIREALQVLVSAGMAEQIPRRGVFVRQPGPVELMEMFEMMAELEAACGRLAATRITDSGLNDLVKANENCKSALADRAYDAYYAENEKFHQIIYRGSANSYLEKQTIQLQNKLKAYRKMQLRFRGRLDQSMAEHVEIVAALQDGDPARASLALHSHVGVQGEKFRQLIASLNS
ncbi:Regulatory protein GntR, HTH:GntR, C-terminal domain [Sulfitobacter noctilucicola]|uniref:DNA-binding GntR family transcriptional regulator n=1 Tax=Sulfitobacter noctilucicola TaxID=1342301 RepID=A0A7W6MAG8_9RHOB|nr:GntR family transcriptional regulator [Sulfitobacter noctilucicola]KIN63511.1 Regulatory protein GntR, HTH:GntR, C-terminal domain [Sulfitobacter noctilucicola]MBB4174978.1 DNA-binding GntR family transcriptional regulator [Sulfitobacter noctilucicola]